MHESTRRAKPLGRVRTLPRTVLFACAIALGGAVLSGDAQSRSGSCPPDDLCEKPPTVPTIYSGPSNPTGSTNASFEFEAIRGDWYRCSLDGRTPEDCSSPATYTVGLGSHTFTVRAVNSAGESGAAGYSWTVVDVEPPSAPGDLTQTGATRTSVTVAWSASSDNAGVVAYDVSPGGSTSGTTFTVAGLECSTSQSVSVTARDAAGNRSSQASISAATSACPPEPPPPLIDPPSAPTLLSHPPDPTGATSATFEFAAARADGYRCALDGGAPFACSSPVSYTVGLGRHSFSVHAYNAGGDSPASAFSWTVVDVEPPSTPTGLAQTVATESSVTLAWSPATDNVGVVAYDVVPGASTTATTFTIQGLACGKTQAFAVTARDAAGNRSQPATLDARTAGCQPSADRMRPSPPSNVRTTGSTATTISIAWDPSSDNVGVVGYDVTPGGPTAATSYTLQGLRCDAPYVVSVVARDAARNTSEPAVIEARTASCPSSGDREPPSAPANLRKTDSTPTSISIAWSDSSDDVGVIAYDLGGAVEASTTRTSYTLSGLTCDRDYAVTVRARDAAGNRSAAASITVSTPCGRPRAEEPPFRNVPETDPRVPPRPVTPPGGRYGVVGAAWMTMLGERAPVQRAASARGLRAHFRFIARPARGAAFMARWLYNNRRVADSRRPGGSTVHSTARMVAGALPRGYWRCVLLVRLPGGGWRPVAEARARLG